MKTPERTYSQNKFYLAVYSGDGMFHGLREWRYETLTPRWLSNMAAILSQNSEKFRISPGGPLSHVELQFTSASGAALVTIYVRGNTVISAALASGANADVDSQIVQMFHASMLNTKFLANFMDGERFKGMTNFMERPVALLVVYGLSIPASEFYESWPTYMVSELRFIRPELYNPFPFGSPYEI